MKRLSIIVVLLCSAVSLTFGQDFEPLSFEKLVENRDTAAIREMLPEVDGWLTSLRGSGEMETADSWMERMSSEFPYLKNPFLIMRERWLCKEWKRDEAMDILHSILEGDPEYLAALSDLAYLSYLSNDYETAIEMYGRLLALEEDEGEKEWLAHIISGLQEEQAEEPLRPDMDALERMVKKDRPQYDALVTRFEAADTTLTVEDVQKVYYGHAFTESYNPMATYHSIVDDLLDEDKPDEAKAAAAGLLKEHPVDLWLLEQLALISDQEDPEYEGYFNRFIILADAIMATGNGRSPGRAVCVIDVSDEYVLLNEVFGMKSLAAQALASEGGSSFDRMDFIDRDEEARTAFFNVDLLFRKYNEMFP
jgi:tetratricopeptide (TPR) repeat protein